MKKPAAIPVQEVAAGWISFAAFSVYTFTSRAHRQFRFLTKKKR